MKERNPIDDLFKNKLEGHEKRPSQNVWSKIESGLEPQKKRVAPVYILRAASVALLIGLSSVWYFNNNEADLTNITVEHNTGDKKTNQKTEKEVKKVEEKNSGEEKTPVKNSKKPEKSVPVLKARPSARSTIYVQHEALKADENIETELEENMQLLAQEELKTPVEAKKPSVKVKFTLKPTVTAYYTETDTAKSETKPFKERILAYASDQVNNLVKGKKLDFPIKDIKNKKPELEITLPEIFNN